MLIIGDVLAVVFALVGACVTAGAMMLCGALLFQGHASRAREACRVAPGRGLVLGLLLTIVLAALSIAFLKVPLPAFKLVGTVVYLSLMAVAAIGASGIALLLSERVAALDLSLSRYGALLRAASILAIACVFPLLGWFLVGPALFIASVGFGAQSLFARRSVYVQGM